MVGISEAIAAAGASLLYLPPPQPRSQTRSNRTLDPFVRFVKIPSMTKRRAVKCTRCGRRFKPASTGRPPRYCSASCRQAAYLARNANRLRPVQLLAADLSHIHVKNWLRREMWNLLREADLVSSIEPPPMPRQRGSKLNLRLVRPDDPRE
jgi:hypothetical protein